MISQIHKYIHKLPSGIHFEICIALGCFNECMGSFISEFFFASNREKEREKKRGESHKLTLNNNNNFFHFFYFNFQTPEFCFYFKYHETYRMFLEFFMFYFKAQFDSFVSLSLLSFYYYNDKGLNLKLALKNFNFTPLRV